MGDVGKALGILIVLTAAMLLVVMARIGVWSWRRTTVVKRDEFKIINIDEIN